ncbi:hypothetical protein GGR57DRAFT_487142 [Xylariaceae sp. FL1272]|nr:hypothetical protein GGR57DRAFT_487142 [Xylariaceae sp. FL1272]
MAPQKNPRVGEYPSITNYTWAYEFLDDEDQPVSPGCFESIAKAFESGQLSYDRFLDAALSHVTHDVRHPEDTDLTNLARLSRCGPMGPVAAAIKLCMLSGESGFSKDIVDILRRMDPTLSAAESLQSALPTKISPLQLQVVVVAALRRGLLALATDILSARPEPPEKSLFNLFRCELCPSIGSYYYDRAPPTFWIAALKARWLAPSPGLAEHAAYSGPSSGPLVRALLDDPALDLTLIPAYGHYPLYHRLELNISMKQEDASLLRDVLARLPAGYKLGKTSLRWALGDRSQGGVGILAALLDHRDSEGCGLDINYQEVTPFEPSSMPDMSGQNVWYEVSLTALHKAAENGNEDAVRFLLARGADVNAKNGHGWTPREVALRHGHKKVARILRQAEGANSDRGRCAMM